VPARLDGQATGLPALRSLPPDRRLPGGVVAAVTASWAVLVAAAVSGTRALDHDAIFGGGDIDWVRIAAFLVAWQVMVAAMMLPTAFPAVREAAEQDESVGLFLAGFAVVWTGFAWGALSVDSTVHRLVDATPWLASTHVVAAGLLLLAGLAQLAPPTGRSLDASRYRRSPPSGPGRGGLIDGVRYGGLCVGCDGGLMLLLFGLGKGGLIPMALATVVMVLERRETVSASVRRSTGIAALVAGVALLAAALA
jgi:predicted metal-binding membrane protein